MKQFWKSWWKLKLKKIFLWKILSINIKTLTRKNLLKPANILLVFELSQTVAFNFFNIFWWNIFKINTIEKIFGESFCKIKNYLSFHQKFFLSYIIFLQNPIKMLKLFQTREILKQNGEKTTILTTWKKILVKNHFPLPSEIYFTKYFF